MAILQSGDSTALQTIDPLSKAARSTLYAPDGRALAFASDRNRGTVQVSIRQTAATAQGAVVWAMRNKSVDRVLHVRRLWWQCFFDGTGQGTEMSYAWRVGSGCTAIPNGSYVVPSLKKRDVSNADIEAKYLDTGLTLTGVTWDTALYPFAWARLTHSATQAGGISSQFVLDFRDEPYELGPDEVFSLYSLKNSIIGDNVIGGVDFCGG